MGLSARHDTSLQASQLCSPQGTFAWSTRLCSPVLRHGRILFEEELLAATPQRAPALLLLPRVPGRFCQMMWRLNFLVIFCCIVLQNSYMLYYICPMHTIFTVLVYACLGICPQVNKTPAWMWTK